MVVTPTNGENKMTADSHDRNIFIQIRGSIKERDKLKELAKMRGLDTTSELIREWIDAEDGSKFMSLPDRDKLAALKLVNKEMKSPKPLSFVKLAQLKRLQAAFSRARGI